MQGPQHVLKGGSFERNHIPFELDSFAVMSAMVGIGRDGCTPQAWQHLAGITFQSGE